MKNYRRQQFGGGDRVSGEVIEFRGRGSGVSSKAANPRSRSGRTPTSRSVELKLTKTRVETEKKSPDDGDDGGRSIDVKVGELVVFLAAVTAEAILLEIVDDLVDVKKR